MNTSLLNQVARYFVIAASIFIISPVYAQTDCGDPSFPAPAEILGNVGEAVGYNLVYQLPLPAANQTWASQADIPYSVNNSASLAGSPYTRVAYYMKLESALLGPQWVWVSMDAFSNDLGQISIPTGSISFQQLVTNMNVVHYALPSRTGITGNIEFWSSCYNATNTSGVAGASDFSYDFGDEIIPGDNCYGSFQVHDFNSLETVFAYNGWAFAGATAEDLGIGNFPGANTDWTLADNAALYDVRELYVFVDAGQAYQPTCNPVTVTLDAAGQATVTASMVTDATIGNCGVTDIAVSQSAFDCADLGDNIITVTVTRNGSLVTCTSVVTVVDNISPQILASGTTLLLGCNPSAADIDAALGSATATDNCGSLVPEATDGSVELSGNTFSQTRSFSVEDASGNPASVSRTVSWPNDILPPVITAAGTTLTLDCNPSAADIDAALGTATVTDDCGTPSLDVTTDPVVTSGNTSSQTRRWSSTDASNQTTNESRTVTWLTECNVVAQNIYQADVSCADFMNGAAPLPYICYTHDRNKVKKVSPKQFYYYAIVKAPAVLGAGSSFYADVVQTKSCASFKLFSIQGNQIRAHNTQCSKISNGSEVSVGQGRVKITNAVLGATYIISVKYEGKALEGSAFTGQAPVCSNSFETRVTANGAFGTGAVAAGSQTSIEVRPNCTIPDPVNVENRISYVSMNDMQDVVASPNPSSNYFELNLSDRLQEIVTIRIFNSNGKLIQSIKGTTSTIIRVGDDWQNGIYFAEVLTGSNRKTLRLVKSR